jgi:hypothetical protein
MHGMSTSDVREGNELYTISVIKLEIILRKVNRKAKAKYFSMFGGSHVESKNSRTSYCVRLIHVS